MPTLKKLMELIANGITEENLEQVNQLVPDAINEFQELESTSTKLDNLAKQLSSDEPKDDEPETMEDILADSAE